MPTESKAKGGGLKKKLGPLPIWGWVAVGGGAFLVVKYLKDRSAASTAAAGVATSGGTTIPTDTNTSPTTPSFSSMAAWEQAAISEMSGSSLSPADALNGLTDWINGQCVTAAQYAGIGSIIETIGLPPGFSTVPVLSVCADATTPTPTAAAPAPAAAAPAPAAASTAAPGAPPNLPAQLIQAMTGNGESVVDNAWDPVTQEWIYLTNKGGIYALTPTGQAGGTFYGSAFNLGNAFAGRTAERLTINPDGGYTITDATGSNYTFGPGADDYANA